MEVKFENKFDSMKKIEKTKWSKCEEFIKTLKSALKRFGFIKPLSGLYDGEKFVAWTTTDFLFN